MEVENRPMNALIKSANYNFYLLSRQEHHISCCYQNQSVWNGRNCLAKVISFLPAALDGTLTCTTR